MTMNYAVRGSAILHEQLVKGSFGNSLVLIDDLDQAVGLSEVEGNSFLSTPVRYAASMSLLVCVEGKIKINVGLKEYEVCSDEVLLLGRGIIAEVVKMPSDTVFFTMIFSDDFCYALAEHINSELFRRSFNTNPVCHVNNMEDLLFTYRIIKDRVNNRAGEVLLAEEVKGYLQGMVFGLCAEYLTRDAADEREAGRAGRKQDLYKRFTELVQKNFAEERNISYYASQLGVTPRYLSQVVYQESGHSASDYIRHFVITEAKQLVSSQQYSVKQISQMLGFTSVSFFSRYFKKMTGYSPKEFQKF